MVVVAVVLTGWTCLVTRVVFSEVAGFEMWVETVVE